MSAGLVHPQASLGYCQWGAPGGDRRKEPEVRPHIPLALVLQGSLSLALSLHRGSLLHLKWSTQHLFSTGLVTLPPVIPLGGGVMCESPGAAITNYWKPVA